MAGGALRLRIEQQRALCFGYVLRGYVCLYQPNIRLYGGITHLSIIRGRINPLILSGRLHPFQTSSTNRSGQGNRLCDDNQSLCPDSRASSCGWMRDAAVSEHGSGVSSRATDRLGDAGDEWCIDWQRMGAE
jgi:hypothetical protein